MKKPQSRNFMSNTAGVQAKLSIGRLAVSHSENSPALRMEKKKKRKKIFF